jgi:23S rRNA pseudouridine1911/1915/1917 synthase
MSRAPALRILFQDNHLFVVAKPVGIPVQGDATGSVSLLEQVREHRRIAEQKPGNVFVGLVHRLDRAVSGVVVFAKTSKAAARLSEQFRDRLVEKIYWAAVELRRPIMAASGVWTSFLKKDERTNHVHVVESGQGLEAVTAWKVLANGVGVALLELQPKTGRPHQLRVHCSAAGWPIVGDRRYGAKTLFPHGIALHAYALAFAHPTTKERLTFSVPPSKDWKALGVDLQGEQRT